MRIPSLVPLVALAALALGAAPPAARAQNVSVLLSGLQNPHGLAFGPDGALYVTEAGIGGAGPRLDLPFGPPVFYGASGAVTRYLNGVQTRIATGLPSLAGAGGAQATGVHDISFDAAGVPHVVIGLGANPAVRANQLAGVGGGFGQLARLNPDGTLTNIADIAGYEATANPAGGPLDSNPFSLLAGIGPGGGCIVVDAGMNALLGVTPGGVITTLAVFPNVPSGAESVPTAVAVGPDGAFYVSELTGFPFPQDQARIWRVPSGGGAPTQYLTGFTNVVDLAFGGDGSLYVLEHDADSLFGPVGPAMNGALIRVAPDGTRTTLLSGPSLVQPTAFTIGPDGAFYISNFGTSANDGQVIRFQAEVPEPGSLALLLCGIASGAGLGLRRRRG